MTTHDQDDVRAALRELAETVTLGHGQYALYRARSVGAGRTRRTRAILSAVALGTVAVGGGLLVAVAVPGASQAPIAEHGRPAAPPVGLAPLCGPGDVFTSLQGARDDATVTADVSSPRSIGVRLGRLAGVTITNLQLSLLQSSGPTTISSDGGPPIRHEQFSDITAHGQDVTLHFDGRDDNGVAVAAGLYPIWVAADVAYACPNTGATRVHIAEDLGNVAVPANEVPSTVCVGVVSVTGPDGQRTGVTPRRSHQIQVHVGDPVQVRADEPCSSRSTSSGSVPTINNGCLQPPSDGPPNPAKEWGASLRFQDVVTLSSPTQKGNPEGLPTTPSSPSTTQNHLQILSQRDAQQLAAIAGATTAELMHRLGHATPDVALRSQRATADRDVAVARALSELVIRASVVPLESGRDRSDTILKGHAGGTAPVSARQSRAERAI